MNAASPYQLLPPLSAEELALLRADVERHGVLVPVEIDEETGEVIDGHHRLQVAAELGVDCPRVTRRFSSDEERIAHVLSLNLMRRHLDAEQRRSLVVQLRSHGWSTRKIATAVQVDDKTVRNDLAGADYSAPARVTGADGKSYPATQPPIVRQRIVDEEEPAYGDGFIDEGVPVREVWEEADEAFASELEAIDGLPAREFDDQPDNDSPATASAAGTPGAGEAPDAGLASPSSRLAPLMSSETPEWYTPNHIIERVFAVLEDIDLDPCADPGKSIAACDHYTKADDGLSQGWYGRVYMNPPYGDAIGNWTRKLVVEFDAGHVTEAIALLPARVDTEWWQPLGWHLHCFIKGRLKFSGAENSAPFPSVLVYLGARPERFKAQFADIGGIYPGRTA